MLNKSEASLTKEMDLRKFILRMRLSINAILGLLSGPQSFLIDKVSHMVIRESSNFEETSSDEEMSEIDKETLGNRIEQMTKSTNIVDKRLMDLYILNQAQQRRLRFGFKSNIINPKTKRQFSIPSKVTMDGSKELD